MNTIFFPATMKLDYGVIRHRQAEAAGSSIGLGFLNPMLMLRCWDVTSLCMQLGNREES